MAQLRQHGYERLEDVSAAYIEGDDHFSVIGRRPMPLLPARNPVGH